MKHRFETRPAFDVVGYTLRTTTVGGENFRAIPQFWDKLHGEGRVDPLGRLDPEFGLLGLCAEFDDTMEAFTYAIGVTAKPGVAYPEGTKRVHLPAAEYAVFGVVGAMPTAIQNAWGEIMGGWFPTSGYEQATPVNFELYPAFPVGDERGDPTSPKCYTEIWIPVRHK